MSFVLLCILVKFKSRVKWSSVAKINTTRTEQFGELNFYFTRASDKRRGIAAEKAEAQKRLFMQPKRSEYSMSVSGN